MKKIFLVLILCFLSGGGRRVANAQIFDLIKAGFDQVSNEMRKLNQEIYEKTMLPKTVEMAATLKKNFDESKRFYDEMKLISERPAVLSDFTREELLKMLRDNGRSIVGRAEIDYEMSYRKPGEIGKRQIAAENYIRNNIKFADWAKDQILGQEKVLEKELLEKKAENKNDTEAQILSHASVQTQTLLLIARLSAQNLEATTKLYDYLTKQERVSIDRSEAWNAEIKKLLEERRAGQKKEAQTSQQVIRELFKK